MKMLYTANGRYIRCCTEEGTRPVIIVCEKEYEVDVQEFMLWSILNWRGSCAWAYTGGRCPRPRRGLSPWTVRRSARASSRPAR